MATLDLKPRTGVELIDASFQFLRENFVLLFTTTAVTYAPIAIVEYMAMRDPTDIGLRIAQLITAWVFSAMAQAATVTIVAARYMGDSITPADALRSVWRRLGTAMGVTTFYGILVSFGTVFFLIPGIYFATKYFAAMAAAMVEGYNTNDAMKRSAKLTDGSKRRVLNIFGLTIIIYLVVNAAIAGIVGTLTSPEAATLIARLLMAVTNPFLFTLVTLVYFDLRIRREGLDLDVMLAPAPATAGAPVAG